MRDRYESNDKFVPRVTDPMGHGNAVLPTPLLGQPDPVVGESFERTPEELRKAPEPIDYGRRLISGLTAAEAVRFAEAIQNV